MIFPESPRVIYKKNPLEQVICQLRFPAVLRIATEVPTMFQDRIRQEYPIFKEQVERIAQLPVELAQLVPQAVIEPLLRTNKSAYDFISADEQWIIGLTSTFLAMTALKYERWEQFRAHVIGPFQALVDTYSPVFFQRIGLRYRDIIRRSDLGLDSVDWKELLAPHISGPLAIIKNAEDLEESSANFLLQLEDNNGKVRIQHGLGKDEKGEVCYIIDSDFFTEQRVEINDAFTRLDYFNQQARRLFRWCITNKVHEAMEPQIIG